MPVALICRYCGGVKVGSITLLKFKNLSKVYAVYEGGILNVPIKVPDEPVVGVVVL